jgi:hypothetical protein
MYPKILSMKRFIILIIVLAAASIVSAVSNPASYNGKTYYIVTSLDPTEDSGDEVCAKVGLVCVGYTEPSTAVCRIFHPNAADTSSMSGDRSGVYCNGPPQAGVCSTKSNTCHSCPACTATVSCDQAVGGLYREMFVECVNPSSGKGCSISMTAKTVNNFINQIPGLNAQLKACPQTIPSALSLLFANGNTQVNVRMNSGRTMTFTVIITGGKVTGIMQGGGPCTQRVSISENDFNSILTSSSPVQRILFLVGKGRITIRGCSLLGRIRTFVAGGVAKLVASFQTPNSPPPKPKPDCGKVGEQCNNRGCLSGICAAPKENLNGQWSYWHYICLSQSEWAGKCEAHGNTPAPWKCITRPCG